MNREELIEKAAKAMAYGDREPATWQWFLPDARRAFAVFEESRTPTECRDCGRSDGGCDRIVQGEPSAFDERHASHAHAGPYCLPQGEPSDAQDLIAEADALVESWDRKGSWSPDSPIGLVMRLAAALRAAAAQGGETR